ncbi:hypothetical protein F2Q68_00015125 [Brassica cretica]|uniref:Uncharacterized protein n=1 Tax=Brassica cretica TaxID=69181 RepID=A0A8S9HAS5_BRACR|nr:hypothetical protein F2Q68_00015125 [Brassica cretica]
MDDPHPDAVPDQRERVRPQKDKGIALEDRNFVSEDFPLPGWNPGFTPGDGSGISEAPLPNDFFANLPTGFTTPSSLDEASRREVVAEGSQLINEGMRVFNSTLDGSFREACLSHFKAEETERKFIRFQNEVAERERRQAESHSRALIRAERKGRRAIAAELARRATLFDGEFRSFKDTQDYVGDFRECRGPVGTLWKSQNADFSFLSEVAEMSGFMDGCAQAESMVPPIEGRIRELWEPIEVSEDTTEAGADAADEGGEVDQPADSFGTSISGPSVAVRYLSVLWPCKLQANALVCWSCASYQATVQDCLFVGPVSHIRQQSGLGISKATPQPLCDLSFHQISSWSSYLFQIRSSDPFKAYQSGIRATLPERLAIRCKDHIKTTRDVADPKR